MPSTTRRSVLTGLSGLVAGSGCLGVLNDSGGRDTPDPASDLPSLQGDTIEVSDSFTFDAAGLYGWRIEGSFTKAVSVSASVDEGHPAIVFVTGTQLSEARVPRNPITHFETPGSVDGVELRNGNGTIVFKVTEPTTLSVTFSAESI